MWPRPTLVALVAVLCIVQAAGPVAAREGAIPLRASLTQSDLPLGGHLAVRGVIVDGRSLGWKELVAYGGTLYASKALLDSLGLAPRPGALAVYTRFEVWHALNALPDLTVHYSFSQKRVFLGTGRIAAAAQEQPAAEPGIRLKSATELSLPQAPAAPAATAATRERLLPLEVRINGARAGSWLLLEKGGALYAPPDAFEEWRLARSPSVRGIEYRGQTWYPLASIAGYEAQYNFAEQAVDLRFLPSAFAATRLGAPPVERPPLSPVLPSFFLNYDVNQTVTAGRHFDTRRELGALMELGFSSGSGVLTSSYVGRNLGDEDNTEPRNWRRLETTFTRDYPEHNVSLRLGDGSTRPGTWGRQVYFGGVQLGRNYALSPGFITYPLPLIAGQSSAPSTVELYGEDVR